jgi:hypothetical protein
MGTCTEPLMELTLYFKKLAILTDLSTGAKLDKPVEYEGSHAYTSLHKDSYAKSILPVALKLILPNGAELLIDNPSYDFNVGWNHGRRDQADSRCRQPETDSTHYRSSGLPRYQYEG